MAKSSRLFAAPAAWKRTLATAGAFTLMAGTFIAGGTAANADSGTFNPFDINNGFTVVSQGDAQLNNGEIEGSIAAFGNISTKNVNGYAVIHAAAGMPGYTVPTIDDVPVRILANEFIGNGAFDVSNRDDSGTIANTSAEAKAAVKLVKTDALTGSQRSDFLRITNSENGLIDLKSVRYPADLTPYKTAQSSVSDYFPGQDAQVAATNACLVSMYDSALELTNNVKIDDQGGMVFVSDFATDKPNVINYADIAGKTIKLDRAAGYKPTAAAPLVIRGAADTKELGQLRFEGWSASASADQSLADYIMVDLSEATGSIKVNGFELGSIWAPNADIEFNSGVTTNGQWFTGGNVTTAGGGEVHHHAFKAQLPCGATVPVEPTDPTDPTDPTTPVDPTDPTEPTTPVEPTDPTTPVEPTDPTTPVEPTDPTEPTTPVEPTDPTEPTTPVEPTDPTDPTTPVEPTDPTNPTVPNEPETGVSPETIANTDPTDSDGEKAVVTDPKADPAETTAVVADPAAALATTGSALTWPLTVGGMLLTVGGISLIMVRRNARA